MRAPVDTIAAPLFPTNLPWVNARGPQPDHPRGQADAGGVLGLLPAELVAHAALREGVARALRAGGPAGVRRALSRLRGLARRAAVRDAVARLGIDLSGADRRRAGRVAGLRQRRLAGALPVRRSRAAVRPTTTARARYAETELAIQELLGRGTRAAGAAAPRGCARCDAGGADGRPAGRLLRSVRSGRRVGGARRRGSGAVE